MEIRDRDVKQLWEPESNHATGTEKSITNETQQNQIVL